MIDLDIAIDLCLECDKLLVEGDDDWLSSIMMTPDMLFIGPSRFPFDRVLTELGDNRLCWCSTGCLMLWIVRKAARP